MDAAATPMGATADSISVRITMASGRSCPPKGISITVDGRRSEIDSWRTIGGDDDRIWFATHNEGDLLPGRSYDVALEAGGDVIASSRATTRPAPEGVVGLVFGSCFDDAQADALVGPIYDQLASSLAEVGATPMNIWMGDQVYVDAPWQRGFFPSDPHKTILGKYRRAWGLGPGLGSDGLAYAMANASNYFLPDDHEFWNGFPHPSFITLPFHTVGRLATQVKRRFERGEAKPPHPSAQGRWGRVAGEAYCVFQTDLDFDRFDEDVNPPQVQPIDLGSAVVVLADTRWHRTIRKTGGRAGFMTDADLEHLVTLLSSEERLVCLALSRPIVGNLPHTGPLRGKIEYAPEDYTRQYSQLWEALTHRADEGWPTIVLGGDVHEQSVKTALDMRLLEIVSSPLALLGSLGDSRIMALRKGWAWVKRYSLDLFRRATKHDDTNGTAFPIIASDGSWTPGAEPPVLPVRGTTSGMAGLSIDASDPAQPLIEVHMVRTVRGQADTWTQTFKWVDGWR